MWSLYLGLNAWHWIRKYRLIHCYAHVNSYQSTSLRDYDNSLLRKTKVAFYITVLLIVCFQAIVSVRSQY